MRLFLQEVAFGLIALVVALAVILPAFVVVDLLIREGYIVALAGILGLAAALILLYSHRYRGAA